MTVNAELYIIIPILKLCDFMKYCWNIVIKIHVDSQKKKINIIFKYTVGFFIIQIKFISTMKIHIVVFKNFPIFSFLSCWNHFWVSDKYTFKI